MFEVVVTMPTEEVVHDAVDLPHALEIALGAKRNRPEYDVAIHCLADGNQYSLVLTEA